MAMARSSLAAAAVLLFLLAPTSSVVLAADDGGTTTHLHVFMHDILTGSTPTAVQVIKGPATSSSTIPGLAFGDTTVIDDALTEGPSSASSAAVGRAQGFYMLTSQSGSPVLTVIANLVLTAGDYNGSTVAVMGRDEIAAEVRELAVVGGTGRFRMATGYVLWKTNSSVVNGPDATIELDVYVSTGGGAIDSSTPVSPVGDGGGSGASSAAAVAAVRGGGGWVSAVVVAVVVAVVGSYVV